MLLTKKFFRLFRKEAEMVGQIVVGYGEIEHDVSSVWGIVLGDVTDAARMFFMGTARRGAPA